MTSEMELHIVISRQPKVGFMKMCQLIITSRLEVGQTFVMKRDQSDVGLPSGLAEESARYIVSACEQSLFEHGDTFRGAGYTKTHREAQNQYAMMLELIRDTSVPASVLDFGCGLAHMFDFINSSERHKHIRYTGLDLSENYVSAARARHPNLDIILMDVLAPGSNLPEYDYVIMNGVFNYRGELSQERMLRYWEDMVTVAYRSARIGLAFNVMSKLVDWERDDLFHLPFDTMADFVWRKLSRNFTIRHDYGTFEYTTYVYRAPTFTR